MRHRMLLAAVAAAVAIGLLAAGAGPAGAVPAGLLDGSFGVGGVVGVNLSDPAPKPPCIGSVVFRCGLPGEGALDTIGRPDGSVIVVTAFADTFLLLMRFTPTGQLDPTFGTGGFTLVGPSAGLTGIATQVDGAGRAYVSWTDDPNLTGNVLFRITRLTASGAVDPTFGSGGTVTHPHDQRWVVAPDGHVFLYRIREVPFAASAVDVVRLTDAGQPDPTYGTGGTAVLDLPAISPEGMFLDHDVDVVPGPAGSLVMATRATTIDRAIPASRIVLGRLTAAGAPDPTLGPGGLAFPVGPASRPTLYEIAPTALAVQPDGAILVGGERTRAPYGSALNVIRFLPSGAPDTTYGFAGVAVIELVPGPVTTNAGFEHLVWLGVDAAGRAVVVGDNGDPISVPGDGQRHVVRLTSTGAPDLDFGWLGRSTLPADLARASRTFTTTGTTDVVGGGTVGSADRQCGLATQTYACPDLVVFALLGL